MSKFSSAFNSFAILYWNAPVLALVNHTIQSNPVSPMLKNIAGVGFEPTISWL